MKRASQSKVNWFRAVAVLVLSTPSVCFGHGSFETPLSRVYNCYLEGPESPDSAACQAAVDVGGTQALYDWNGVNIANANGNHQALIPDGELCSAGREQHWGLDLARGDWVSTSLTPNENGEFEFVYYSTAPHATRYFEFYVTRPGYNPLEPLKWSDLESEPFCVITDVVLVNSRYTMTCPLPGSRTGKHVIYNIWQRLDSPEAFYACVDVELPGDQQADSDSDGVFDDNDNCILNANSDQIDIDADGLGNRCDPDFNNDCQVNFLDYAAMTSNFFSTTEFLFDLNSDGAVNFLDSGLFVDFYLGSPGPSGVTNVCQSSR